MNHIAQPTSSCCNSKKLEKQDSARCFHCQAPIIGFVDISASIDGMKHKFCSRQCREAAEFIQQNDYGEFYSRRARSVDGLQAGLPADSGSGAESWQMLDDEALAKPYVRYVDSNTRELTLDLPGLYCASCSWLIDKAMQDISPSIDTHIDASAKRAWLQISDPQVPLSELVSTIARLGYRPYPIALEESVADVTSTAIAERRKALKRIAVAGFGMMQVMTYAVALYFGDYQGMDQSFREYLNLISMLVATLVVFYSGRMFFDNAWNDIKHGRLGMDVPIALAIGGAYFPSVYQTLFRSEGHIYFDSAVMFIFFLSLGRFVEASARHRLSSAPAALSRLLPSFITVKRQSGDQWIETDIKPQQVLPGDKLLLDEQQVVPFDGRVLNGKALMDESIVTGESQPISCAQGSCVIAGSRLLQGNVELVAEKHWLESSICRIEQLLRSAQIANKQQQGTLQQVARNFVAFVLLITTITAVIWWTVAPERVFQIVLAMLVASCPCAFSLAAPVGATAAGHALRTKGLLLSNFAVLSVLPKVTSWCFDKTGTLTQGKPCICAVVPHGESTIETSLEIAGALEVQSQHVLANAFSAIGSQLHADELQQYAGRGVSGEIAGEHYFLGNPAWVLQQAGDWKESARAALMELVESNQCTVVALGSNTEYIASFIIEDQIRPHAAQAIEELRAHGHRVLILSGDRQVSAENALRDCDIDLLRGDLLPEQKMEFVRDLQNNGEVVAMVGDGINDAPVIARADVSIAMSSGSELSQSQADVIVLNGRLDSLAALHTCARRTQVITRQNLLWALLYNAVALPMAAAGLLTPWIAALGMSLSSLLVVLNALRIARHRH
ncbi:MAG: cation-translocating P-type ATPase [Arenicella sp.]|nr:cation-translocating P-type ATPase [Arenicella sp.]